MLKARVTASVLASLLVWSGQGTPPPPAIGDIRLVPYHGDPKLRGYFEVQIYYTDGVTQPDFGGVCANNSYKEEGTVICSQMGYSYSGFEYTTINSSAWFNYIECDDINTPHILRCHTSVTSSRVCKENHRLLVKCNFTQPLVPYDGQVALCPIDISNEYKFSTSFGLVGLYYQDHGAWKGINQKRDGKLLGAYEADTICRQMGFTGAYPGTAVARSVDNYSFSNCLSNKGNVPPFRFTDGAWITTNDITCQEPQNCLGCCFKYPGRGNCGNCNVSQNLVIRCAFDPSKIKLSEGTAGSEDTCKLDSNKNVGHCTTADNSSEVIQHLKIALGVVASFLVLLGPCGWYCLCRCYRNKLHNRCKEKIQQVRLVRILCCKDYMPIEQQVDNNRQNAEINQNQNVNQAA